jgi:hypothetical protein
MLTAAFFRRSSGNLKKKRLSFAPGIAILIGSRKE